MYARHTGEARSEKGFSRIGLTRPSVVRAADIVARKIFDSGVNGAINAAAEGADKA